jgi:RteC protein
VQIQIPFTDSQMSDPWSDAYERLISNLPDYHKLDHDNILPAAQLAIEAIRKAINVLRDFCKHHSFPDQVSEIRFFKSVKPRFHAQLIFWMNLFDLELQKPIGSIKHEKKYLKKRMSLLEDYFEKYKDFYSYCRSGQTDRDTLYFTRRQKIPLLLTNPHMADSDPTFSTSQDYLAAGILANDMFLEYLLYRLARLKSNKLTSTAKTSSKSLQWTASKSGVVELIYALYTEGVFNNGKARVSEIATAFQEKFEIKLVNYYHTFNEIRLRKKNRTVFLETLRDRLSKKMDEMEEE